MRTVITILCLLVVSTVKAEFNCEVKKFSLGSSNINCAWKSSDVRINGMYPCVQTISVRFPGGDIRTAYLPGDRRWHTISVFTPGTYKLQLRSQICDVPFVRQGDSSLILKD